MLRTIRAYALIPVGRAVVSYQAADAWWRSRGKKPVVHHERAYAGEKILLVALYEKGLLRPDMRHLMATAREQGYYVVGVNTLRLTDPQSTTDVIDCYIERSNFGRDFGSYQTGFLHVFDRGWHRDCPRLMMLNDSTYYCMRRSPRFLSDMMSSDLEVLGSTENYEFEHHLGSFCISMAGTALRHPALEAYWREYRLSDIRPKVIRRGEMKLSKTLKRVASSPDQFGALYGASRYADELAHDDQLLWFAIANTRRSGLLWKNTGTPGKLALEILKTYATEPPGLVANAKTSRANVAAVRPSATKPYWVADYPTLISALTALVGNPNEIAAESVHRALVAVLVNNFIQGSQVHQNGAILLRMGLPLIKLDSVYRGVANVEDVEIMMSELDPAEARIARELLMQRPFGAQFLRGWRLGAFHGGYL